MFEALAIALGTTAAKTIFAVWTGANTLQIASTSVVDLVAARVTDQRERNRIERQLSGLADTLADQLEPLILSEIAGLEENEALAATDAVARHVASLGNFSQAVIAVDFDATAVEGQIRRNSNSDLAKIQLSEHGIALYDVLLTECCVFITSVAAQLPGFETQNARELLRRESELMKLAQRILDAIPRSTVPGSWGPGTATQRFETRYLRAVADYSDRLELYGVNPSAARRPYELSIAYISLGISVENVNTTHDIDTTSGEATPVEDFLRAHRSVVVTGDAGSGKTTLLRWIAAQSARSAGRIREDSPWTGRVPFIIPLRSFVDAPLPTPAHFIELVAVNLAEVAPPGYVHNVLADRRALLLVDGLDELPQDRRLKVLEWVRQLDLDFPGSTILVTSRGTALTSEWRNAHDFTIAALQPMDPVQIHAFVDHWHEAVQRVVPSDEADSVRAANRALNIIIREKLQIRTLCTTPLLCALICAIHLDNGASLPIDRMSLYRTALEMLLMKRDNDRQLARREADLSLRDREILLHRFAQWMHENGLADTSRTDYEASIERTMPTLYRVMSGADAVARFVLERCGVLREPSPGRIDFIHRSFLEYMAAAAEVSDDSMQKLVLHGADDAWREVIVLSAGHANVAQLRILLTGLLERGEKVVASRHRLYLLAVACMQTAPQLPEDLRKRLESVLSEVVPPTNMAEAVAVASAGDSAAQLLRRGNTKVMEAVASVRALALIGTPEALETLKSYRRESRITVIRQLIRAWSSFDARTYAEDVLRDSGFIRGALTVTDLEQLPHLHLFERLRSIDLNLSTGVRSWSDFAPVSADLRVVTMSLSTSHWMTNFHAAPTLPSLRKIELGMAPSLESLVGLDKFSKLEELTVQGAVALEGVESLGCLSELRTVRFDAMKVQSLQAFSCFPKPLNSLTLVVSEIRALGRVSVRRLSLVGYSGTMYSPVDPADLADSESLDHLSIYGIALPTSLKLPPTLESLHTDAANTVFTGEGLTTLMLSAPPDRSTLDTVVHCERLNSIRFRGRISDTAFAAFLQSLPAERPLQVIREHMSRGVFLEVPGWSHDESAWQVTYRRV